ncbi:MAG: EI24 domain-containing protein [Deltaproteobacteria bacterium]|nr:EI24 domain-containing protein [Deltaproteobacteria bacterium]
MAGARAAVDGVRFVLSEPRLRWLAAVPMAVHAALLAGLVWAGVTYAVHPLGETLSGQVPSLPPWLGGALSAVAHVTARVLVLGCALVGAVVTGTVLCDPFYDLLSERTEQLLLGRSVDGPMTVGSVLSGMVREAGAAAFRFTLWAMGALVLGLLSLTPAVVVAGPLSFAWTWLFAAWEYFARSFSRHGLGALGGLRAAGANKAVLLGFGAVASVLSLFPFTAPFLVVGATQAYLALAARGEAPSRLSGVDAERLRQVLAGGPGFDAGRPAPERPIPCSHPPASPAPCSPESDCSAVTS